jgi:hypothetical protein
MIQSIISPSNINTLSVEELKHKYFLGQRNFENVCLRKVDLTGTDLRYINFKNSDLSNSDLSNAILYGANLENATLNSINLNRANLQGAFLANATMACGCFDNADLRDVDLHNASLDAATFNRTILEGADLSGAYLVGAEIQQARLSKAYFSYNTCLPKNFNPLSQKMLLETTISIEVVLKKFNYLTQQGNRYFGAIMTAKNWELSRPESDFLERVTVSKTGEILFSSFSEKNINKRQRHDARKWMINFINTCSKIIRDFPCTIDLKQIIF